MLLRLQFVGSRRLLAEVKEFPDLIPELRQRPVIHQREVIHSCIVTRCILSSPRKRRQQAPCRSGSRPGPRSLCCLGGTKITSRPDRLLLLSDNREIPALRQLPRGRTELPTGPS